MVYIALDIGQKRTGIAKSDSMGIIIKPLKTILTEDLLEEIENLNQELGIEKLIIGDPKNPGGANQDAKKMLDEKLALIQRNFPELKLQLIDESFTSREAENLVKQKGIKIDKNNKDLLDQYAAAIILETYWQLQGKGYHPGENT